MLQDKIDSAKAIPACRKALAENPSDARIKFQLGRSLAAAKSDPAEIAKLYREAAEAGFALAMNNLSLLYQTGEGVSKDDAQATEWLRKAAEKGLPLAQYSWARRLISGEGVNKNEVEAASWLKKASHGGFASAMTLLGALTEVGSGVPKDEKAANELYRGAADAGDTDAMRFLATNFEEGKGVAKNVAEAATWRRKAADAGDAAAMRAYGVMLENGEGIGKDEKAANDWYHRAADAGDSNAMRFLAMNYRDGKGIEKSQKDADVWFEKANAASSENAQWDASKPITKDNFENSTFARLGLHYNTYVSLKQRRNSDAQILQALRDIIYVEGDPDDRNEIVDYVEMRKFDPKGTKPFLDALLEYKHKLKTDPEIQSLKEALGKAQETGEIENAKRIERRMKERMQHLRRGRR